MSTGTQADIAAVQMMMERFGLTVADLGTGSPTTVARLAPTFADHIPAVASAERELWLCGRRTWTRCSR